MKNKIDKTLVRLAQKNSKKTQITKIKNEKGKVTTDLTEVKMSIRNTMYNYMLIYLVT